MAVIKKDSAQVRASEDIVSIRRMIRQWAIEAGLNLLDQTKIVTAGSELARNMVNFAGGGVVHLEIIKDDARTGLKLVFEDTGPGIPDISLAMQDGYTTGDGLGLGLGGAKRLVNEFSIETEAGSGTRVTIIRWK